MSVPVFKVGDVVTVLKSKRVTNPKYYNELAQITDLKKDKLTAYSKS